MQLERQEPETIRALRKFPHRNIHHPLPDLAVFRIAALEIRKFLFSQVAPRWIHFHQRNFLLIELLQRVEWISNPLYIFYILSILFVRFQQNPKLRPPVADMRIRNRAPARREEHAFQRVADDRGAQMSHVGALGDIQLKVIEAGGLASARVARPPCVGFGKRTGRRFAERVGRERYINEAGRRYLGFFYKRAAAR